MSHLVVYSLLEERGTISLIIKAATYSTTKVPIRSPVNMVIRSAKRRGEIPDT